MTQEITLKKTYRGGVFGFNPPISNCDFTRKTLVSVGYFILLFNSPLSLDLTIKRSLQQREVHVLNPDSTGHIFYCDSYFNEKVCGT